MGVKYNFLNKIISQNEIVGKRKLLMSRFSREARNVQSGKFSSISIKDLYFLFDLYNDIFFEMELEDPLVIINFSLSKRMTKSAGKTIFKRQTQVNTLVPCMFEIRIGVDFFFNYDLTKKNKQVCGIETTSSLEALLLVFEHELCHVIERLCFGDSDCSKERYKEIAMNLFGHTASHHQLPTYKQIAYEHLDLKVGDIVYFTFEGKQQKGIINRITKRATVMVKNKSGNYQDGKGNRYKKFYVPLTLLGKVKKDRLSVSPSR